MLSAPAPTPTHTRTTHTYTHTKVNTGSICGYGAVLIASARRGRSATIHEDTKRAFAGHSDRTIMTSGVSRTRFTSFLFLLFRFFLSPSFFLAEATYFMVIRRANETTSRNEMETARRTTEYMEGRVSKKKEKKRADHYMKILRSV